MNRQSLYIYYLDKDGIKRNFPDNTCPAKLSEYTYSAQRMGDAPSLSATLNYPSCLDKKWTKREFVVFNGETYYLTQIPTSEKNNKDIMYKHDLSFISERAILSRVYFLDVVSEGMDTIHSNSATIKFMGDIHEFVARINASMKKSGLSYSVVVDKNITSENKMVSLDKVYLSEGIDAIKSVYNLPYYFVGKVCHVGYMESEVAIPFEYQRGLISVKKNNDNKKIVNRISGCGSSENLPFYYPNATQFGNVTNIPIGFDPSIIENINYDLLAVKTHGFLNKTLYWRPSEYVWGNRKHTLAYKSQRTITIITTCTITGEKGTRFKLYTNLSETLTTNNNLSGLVRLVYIDNVSATPVGGASNYHYEVVIPRTGIPLTLRIEWRITISPQVALPYTLVVEDLSKIYGLSPLDRWSFVDDGKVKYLNYKDAGIVLSDKSKIHYNDGLKFTATKTEYARSLMPPIYFKTNGAERFYNAINNKYLKPNSKTEYYAFENEYTQSSVSEHLEDFEEIKPTIEGIENTFGFLFGEIADVAFDANDSDELGLGEGNRVFNGTNEYIHSYFYIKLNIFNGAYGFNLFDHALEGETATINMTSGKCAACAFPIGVTYKESEPFKAFNPVRTDANGSLFSGDFEQKVTSNPKQYTERQQDTSKNMVWIAVKKENSTFGIVMPNVTNKYFPQKGDKFVITGIKMPYKLISFAEKKLEDRLIEYMAKNNKESFSFSVSLSRIYLSSNPYVYSTLNENSLIHVVYDKQQYDLYVSSYKCQADKNCLYNISVELTKELCEETKSSITQSIESAMDKIADSYNKITQSDKELSSIEKAQLASDNIVKALNSDETLTLAEKLSLLRQYQQITGHMDLYAMQPPYLKESEAGKLIDNAISTKVAQPPIATYESSIGNLREVLFKYDVGEKQNSVFDNKDESGEYVYRKEINNAFSHYFSSKAALELAIQEKQNLRIDKTISSVDAVKILAESAVQPSRFNELLIKDGTFMQAQKDILGVQGSITETNKKLIIVEGVAEKALPIASFGTALLDNVEFKSAQTSIRDALENAQKAQESANTANDNIANNVVLKENLRTELQGKVPLLNSTGTDFADLTLKEKLRGEKGADGFTWRPSVSSTGMLTWAKDASTTTPTQMNIKGPQGLRGFAGGLWINVNYSILDKYRVSNGSAYIDMERLVKDYGTFLIWDEANLYPNLATLQKTTVHIQHNLNGDLHTRVFNLIWDMNNPTESYQSLGLASGHHYTFTPLSRILQNSCQAVLYASVTKIKC